MAILVDADSRICVQGITGRIGQVQARYMQQAGTRIVSGVTPGKGGQEIEDVPVYDSVGQAQAENPADVSVLFVPPPPPKGPLPKRLKPASSSWC